MIDIWERGYTFPAPILASFREKLTAPAPSKCHSLLSTRLAFLTFTDVESTTPEGSPAPGSNPLGVPSQQSANGGAAAPDTSSILKALADMAKQNTTAPVAPAPANPLSAMGLSAAAPQPVAATDPSSIAASAANPYAAAGAMPNPFAALGGMGQNPGLGQPPSQSQTPNPMAGAPNPLASMLPQAAPASAVQDPNALSQQLQLLQMLSSQGIPQDQWGTALQLFTMTNGMAGAMPAQLPGFPGMPAPGAGAWPQPDTQPRDNRERERNYNRSPPGYRRRSRSPGWDRRRTASPPRRRDSPVYGEYHGDSPGRRGDPRDSRGRRGPEYRQRSPPGRRRRSPSPPQKDLDLPPPGPKLIEWDYSIGQNNMKVLSRTLFVGGVTSTEPQLRALFNQFGLVQTCIVNTDKRHAFIKMISRQDAMQARDGMESYRSGEMQLRTRWGVGFGPRDCSDYQTGISIIPIERLTEADRKWMVTAEYGGTGGRTIESGMVVEEPDIEIGAGVSSKAISRRIATDTGGKRGPISSRINGDRFGAAPGPVGGGGGGGRRQDRDGFGGAPHHGPGQSDRGDMSNANNPAVAPAVPAYGFNFASMPMLPPGFMMGGAQAGSMPTSQPPPPGQGN